MNAMNIEISECLFERNYGLTVQFGSAISINSTDVMSKTKS